MTAKQIIWGLLFTNCALLSCNKEIRTSYSIESLDKNRLLIIEDEAQWYENICGNYVGVIKALDGSFDNVRMVLMSNSSFEVFQEDLGDAEGSARLRGTYTINSDTLILHHIIDTKKFLVKKDKLHYILEYCPGHEGLAKKNENAVLYKID